MMKLIGLFVITLQCLVISSTQLNVPRVLLPYNHEGSPLNFTLKVNNGGCYKWSSSRDEVHLEELFSYNGCSKEAVVSAITRSSARITAIVFAKDIESGISLRCDVIVDSIKKLEIFTTTRELYVEEAPEEFIVRAYDDYGNEFTSLNGIRFHWDLQTITDHKAVVPAQSVLRMITFESSPYKVPISIGELEGRGEQGYTVLIEGRQTGQAILSTRLTHNAYKMLPIASVDLMVIANLILEPQDVYILTDTIVYYSIYNLKQGLLNPVDVQSSQFYLQVFDTSIGKLESNGIHVTGLSHGSTQVILRDNNVKASETLKQPTANLHVVEPSYLTITIHPHNNPSLIVDHAYHFSISIFDKNNHRILITDNIRVDTELSDEHFTTEFTSQNGTYISAMPFKAGKNKLTAKLTAIVTANGILTISPVLSAHQDLEILQKILVLPPLVVLPWDPVTRPTYKLNFTVDMYEDLVVWSSSRTDIVAVNRIGSCTTSNKGVSIITAAHAQNPHNSDSAKVVIEDALSLYLLDSELEVEVTKNLRLPIALATMVDGSERFFSMCQQVPFEVESEHSSFVSLAVKHASTETTNSCVELELEAQRGGFAKVKVMYSSSSGKLESDTTLGAFHPLKVVNPSSQKIVLALETSHVIVFEGGPLPWIKKPAFHSVLVSSSSRYVEAKLLEPKSLASRVDHYDVSVECRRLGQFTVTLSVSNKPSSTLPFPKNVSASVSVICAVPESLRLQSLLDISKLDACPLLHGQDMVIANCRGKVPLKVLIMDGEGRKFDNISSLALDWSISDEKIATLIGDFSHNTHLGEGIQDIKSNRLVGDVIVTAELSGYSASNLQGESISNLKDSIIIQFVEEPKLQPSHLILFNHKDVKEELTIIGGSRHFELLNLEHQSVVKATFKSDKSTIMVSPLADGNTTLTVRDLCLVSSNQIKSVLNVSSVSSLDLVLSERVEVGSRVKAEVLVRDAGGDIIPAHPLMNLEPNPLNNIISVRYEGTNSNHNAVFSIKGLTTGLSSLKISSSEDKNVIFSPSRPLQVFRPLHVLPRNITLIVGSTYQVETRGGPHPDSSIEYFVKEESIATTSSAGIITARALGTTSLTANSIVILQNEQPLVVSQDTILITVIPMESIRIYSPLRHIEVGASMPLYVFGADLLMPSSYAVADPPLSFEWTLSNGQLAQINTPYHENEITEGKENVGVVRFEAMNPGRITVTVKVMVTVPHSSDKYQIPKNVLISDEIELTIFNSLTLKQPSTNDAKILLSPKAQTTIRTNRGKEGLIYTSGCETGITALVDISDGVITAKSSMGETAVTISVNQPFGVSQNVALLVEVRPIKYLQVIPELFLETEEFSVLSGVPLGTSHSLSFQFHDDRGRKFTSTDSKVEYRLSRFDRINIVDGPGNNSVTVTARDAGQTIVYFWLKDNPSVSDYLKITSAAGINPHKSSVALGSLVCFSSILRGLKRRQGIWKSDDPGFQVDTSTGIGYGRQIGKYRISYRFGSNEAVTSTEVNVLPVTEIVIDASNVHISNFESSDGWFIPVTISTDHQNSAQSCYPVEGSPRDVPFKCYLSFDGAVSPQAHVLFTAAATYVPGTGFGCEIKSKLGPDASLATLQTGLWLECIVSARGQQPETRSNPTLISFSPAVVADKNELMFSPESGKQEIILVGHKSVLNTFIVLEERGVTVEMDDCLEKQRRISVSATDSSFGSDSSLLLLTSTLTHQVIEVKITYRDVDTERCMKTDLPKGFIGVLLRFASVYQSPLISLAVLLITFIALYVGYQVLTQPGYKQTQDTSVFVNSPSKPPPVTPLRPIVTQRQSPNFSLWSDNTEPVYGMPSIRTSPRPAYNTSQTYTS